MKINLINKIKYNNVKLRKIKLTDINKQYQSWLNDKDVIKYLNVNFKKKIFIKDIIKYVKSIIKFKNDNLYAVIYVSKLKKQIHVGNIRVGPIDRFHKVSPVGYIIGDKRFWNKNLGTIMIKKIKEICKKKHKIKKIYCNVSEFNISSQKILLKNKFKLEGIFRKHLIFKNKRCDLYCYTCLL